MACLRGQDQARVARDAGPVPSGAVEHQDRPAFPLDLRNGAAQGLERALGVGLDDQIQGRLFAAQLIEEARESGARLKSACQELGIDVCTYQRWTQDGGIKADGRPEAVRPAAANKLTPEERAQVLAIS